MDIEVKKIGVRVKTRSLVLVYFHRGDEKYRQLVMPVRNLSEKTEDFVQMAKDMQKRHHDLLQSIPLAKIEKMIRILQEYEKNGELVSAVETVRQEFSVHPNEDLNKIPEEELRRKKEVMDEDFRRSQLKPGDPDFVYDKRVDFEITKKSPSEWDSGGEDEDDW